MVWACSGRISREWTDQSTVGHKYPVWQSDRTKMTWPNSYWQERTKGDNYWIAVPADVRVEEKESGKVPEFEKEIRRLWKLRNVEIVPVVIGGVRSVPAEFDSWMGKLGAMLA